MAAVRSSVSILLEGARRASARLMTERDDARENALCAIRALEQRLQEAIAGDGLRGLCRLSGDGRSTFRAAHVGGKAPFGIDAFLPHDGRESLVITKDGELHWARLLSDGAVSTRMVQDEELRIEHQEPVVQAVRDVLDRHIQRSERTADSYARATEFAARLVRVLGE